MTGWFTSQGLRPGDLGEDEERAIAAFMSRVASLPDPGFGSRESGFGIRNANSVSQIQPESRIPNPDSRFFGARTWIASDARIEDSILWDDVQVEANARLRRCIVTDGVRVPPGLSCENATIRIANGALTDGERLVGDLAVGSL